MTTQTTDRPPTVYEKRRTMLNRVKARALHDVNEWLVARGRPPIEEFPKGRRFRVRHCPIARATGCLVGHGDRFGPHVPAFRRAFDEGRFPELVE